MISWSTLPNAEIKPAGGLESGLKMFFRQTGCFEHSQNNRSNVFITLWQH